MVLDARRPVLPMGFAHRGGMAHNRENTIAAFSYALELGAEGLESDVWVTADGVAVLDHDGVVTTRDRVRRPIAECARADLADHIPALSDLYDICGTDFELSLDVKEPAAATEAMQVAERHGALERLWLCSPSRRLLKSWRQQSKDVKLVDSVPMPLFARDRTARIEALAPLSIDALNIRHPAWSPELIDAVHAQGKLAFAWDVQDQALLDRLLAAGIDGVYSDHVDRLVAAITRRRSAPGATPG